MTDKSDILKITVVIPSLNPDEKLIPTVKGMIDLGFSDILVVNDGSSPEHLRPFEEAAAFPQVTVLVHEVNKGKGRALKTAMKYYLENRKNGKGIVTMDGDGQHDPSDVYECAKAMLERGETVLGVRDFKQDDVPWKSRTGNNITKAVFRILCGIKISDTQTGLRAFPDNAIGFLSEAYGERYEYETNMLLEMKHAKMPFSEVTIKTIYIDENATSHFHPFRDGFKIYAVIFKYFGRRLGYLGRYALSSGLCSVIDFALFFIFNVLFNHFVPSLDARPVIMLSTAGARIISSVCNFLINKKAVFGSGSKSSILKYALLAVVILVSSGLIVTGLTRAFSMLLATDLTQKSLAKTIIKLPVDTLLFFVSYKLQKIWVFKEEKTNE
jgi:glycosyltransferase involved in cell wall biosynthesis